MLIRCNRVRIDCAISESKEYMLLIIWAKNCNFFQKCTHSPFFDPNSLDYYSKEITCSVESTSVVKMVWLN